MQNLLESHPKQPTPAQAAKELLRRRQARRSLLPFIIYTSDLYRAGWHHRLLCATLDRFAAGAIRRLMIFMPPQHGKSECVSRRLPAFMLGCNPDTRIIAASHTATLASAMSRDVQRVIDCEAYARLFPGTRLSDRNVRTVAGPMPLRNSEVFEIVGHRGYHRSVGVGTAVVGHGFDVGIIDDPHAGREAADSPAQREAVWSWYTGDFYTRRGKDARIAIVATRWHPEDLPGKLLRQAQDEPAADQWTVLRLPAIADESCSPDDPRQAGEPLWPERYPLEALAATKAANPYDWYSQYQQQPRSPGSQEWPDEYFNRPGFWFTDWPTSGIELRVMALDPSKGSDSKSGDYQALIKFARDASGTEWIEADLSKRPMTAPVSPDGVEIGEGMVEFAVDQAMAFNPEGLAVETNAFQQLLAIPFRGVAARRKYELRFYGVDNRVNKNVRIRRLGEPLSQGRMRFRDTPGTRLLVEQLRQFPNADHDDGPDALEMCRRFAIELWNGRVKRR